MKNGLIVRLFFLVIIILRGGSEVYADPPLPLPRMPICGDQDDPTNPPVFHCSDLIPLTDIQAFQVPGTSSANLTFDFVFREAVFNNELGFFKVDDASGTIGGISPDEPGYLAVAFGQATIVFPSGSNAFTPDVNLQLNANDILVFFIIQNGTLENFIANNPNNDINGSPLAFFSIETLNPDAVDHFVGFESISDINTHFGFEDMTNGGDLDYDDVVYNIIPPIDPVCPPNRWYGQYYDNRDLQGNPVLLRCDEDINFFWGEGIPGSSVPPDNFSIRWNRTINFSETGWYRFRTFTDDGLRLYLDGEELINDWVARSFAERSTVVELDQGTHQLTMEYVEWSGDAIADLNWYLCPGGKSDCSLSITPMYQTEYLENPMPNNCTDEPNQTIARWGCAVTSVAMALQNYGVNVTPDELNEWLTNEGGYDGSPCTAYLLWDMILKFAAKPEHGGINLKWRSTNDAISIIREGIPVIMQVAGGGHYTLAVDVIEVNGVETLGINDPHHSWSCTAVPASLPPASILQCTTGPLKHATTVDEEAVYRGVSTPLKYLEVSTEARTASLQFSIQGVEVLLTDLVGYHVGYDEITGQVVTEISNSFYYGAEIVPPGSKSTGILARTLYLPENAGGIYTLRVIGNVGNVSGLRMQSNYEIRLFGFDEQFNSMEANVSGILEEGEIVEYLVIFEPGQVLSISPLSSNYLPIIQK